MLVTQSASQKNGMKIFRAVGLLIFLFFAQVVVGEMFRAVSSAVVATLETLETASHTATVQLQKIE